MSEEKKIIHVKNLIIKADKVILDTDDIEKDKDDHKHDHDHDHDKKHDDNDPIFGFRRKKDDDGHKHDEKHDHEDKKDEDDKDKRRRNFWF
ncbi:hypothetical protein SFC66_13350 [Terribacillus saccharophilus]|uniref:hypothetical protein n=1 Tax=Terribacillus saccharophilus TaxID=361277 RepID=UPI003981C742